MQAEKVYKAKDRVDWLMKRRELGIGGSEMAAVLGASKWKSAIDVWLEKRETKVPASDENNEYCYWGTVLEDVVAKEFTKRTGMKVRKNNYILQNPNYPWLFADIDREIIGMDAGLECKTANAYVKDEWEGDNLPDAYYIQCQHYMAVTGYSSWWIACLIGGNHFVYKEIPRDEVLIRIILNEGCKFWEYVKDGIVPSVDGSLACTEALKKLHPQSDETSVELPLEAGDWIEKYNSATEQIAALEIEKAEARNQICSLLGSAEKGKYDTWAVSWKSRKASESFDKKKFQKDHPELAKEYIQLKPGARVFSIKNIGL